MRAELTGCRARKFGSWSMGTRRAPCANTWRRLDGESDQAKRHSVSLTDPGAVWTAAPGGPAFFGYSTNYLIDVQAGIVLDVEATGAVSDQEVEATKKMIERVEQQLELKPNHLIGDTAYGAAPMLAWLVKEKKIEPHIPVWDKAERQDGTFSRTDFTFEAQDNRYACPGGRILKPRAAQRPKGRSSTDRRTSSVRSLPVESQVLPQHAKPQDRPQRARVRLVTLPEHWQTQMLIEVT